MWPKAFWPSSSRVIRARPKRPACETCTRWISAHSVGHALMVSNNSLLPCDKATPRLSAAANSVSSAGLRSSSAIFASGNFCKDHAAQARPTGPPPWITISKFSTDMLGNLSFIGSALIIFHECFDFISFNWYATRNQFTSRIIHYSVILNADADIPKALIYIISGADI